MKFNVKVGQKVFLEPHGNYARRYQKKIFTDANEMEPFDPTPYREGIVEKIARKYFYVKSGNSIVKVSMEDYISVEDDINAYYVVWDSIEAAKAEWDAGEMRRLLLRRLNKGFSQITPTETEHCEIDNEMVRKLWAVLNGERECQDEIAAEAAANLN